MPKASLRETIEEDAPPPCILTVEADILIRQPLAAYLRDCGYRVLEAMNAEEAIALLSAKDLPVDSIIASAGGAQTGGDGFALASWVRANRPEVKVILTGTVAGTVAKAGEICSEGPAEDKPDDHRTLLDKIRRTLAHRDRTQKAS